MVRRMDGRMIEGWLGWQAWHGMDMHEMERIGNERNGTEWHDG